MPSINKREALLRSIDDVIEKHAKSNPELLRDLQELRTEYEKALRARRWLDLVNITSRIAILLKFIFDHLPPH